MMSEPVTIRIIEELRPDNPFPYDWEIWVGDELVLYGDECFRERQKAWDTAVYKLRTLKEALQMGVRDEDGSPVDLDTGRVRYP